MVSTYTSYFNSIYKTNISYFQGKPLSIKGYLIDSLYGHYFEFSNNGIVKLYCYYTGSNNNTSFIRKFNKEGQLVYEQGNPFVDMIPSENDSVDLFFSNPFYSRFIVDFSFGKNEKKELPLKSSSMQPMLLEDRVPSSDSMLYLSIITIENVGGNKKVYDDSLFLH